MHPDAMVPRVRTMKLLWSCAILLLCVLSCSDRWNGAGETSDCALPPNILGDIRWSQNGSVPHAYACARFVWPTEQRAESQLVVVKPDGTILHLDDFGRDPSSNAPLRLDFATKGRFRETPRFELLVFGSGGNTEANRTLCRVEMKAPGYECLNDDASRCWFAWRRSFEDGGACVLQARNQAKEVIGNDAQDAAVEPIIDDDGMRESTFDRARDSADGGDGSSEPMRDVPASTDTKRPDNGVRDNGTPDERCTIRDSRKCRPNQLPGCEDGEQKCTPEGVWGPCRPVGASIEVCDGKDNDCNGKIDDQGCGQPRCSTYPCVVTLAGPVDQLPGPAKQPILGKPAGVVFDAKGTMYIADERRNQILKVDASFRLISLVAGSGFPGNGDGNRDKAEFDGPTALTIDPSGNLYVADTGNHAIRKIDPMGNVTTLYTKNGMGPRGIAFYKDAGGNDNLVFSGYQNHTVYQFLIKSRLVFTFYGRAGVSGFENRPGTLARFHHPAGVVVDSARNIYVADSGNHCIRRIDPKQQVTTFTGASTPGLKDGVAGQAFFHSPWGLAIDGAKQTLYVSEPSTNNAIRKIELNTASVTTFSIAKAKGYKDGPLVNAQINEVLGLATHPTTQKLYLADSLNRRIRGFSLGTVSIMVTDVGASYSGKAEGFARVSALRNPRGMALTSSESKLFITDSGNHRVMEFAFANSHLSRWSGKGVSGRDLSKGKDSLYKSPIDIKREGRNSFLMVEQGNHRLIALTGSGGPSLRAGSAVGQGGFQDGSSGLMLAPAAIAFSGNSFLWYVAESENHCIRKVTRSVLALFAGLSSGGMGCRQGSSDGRFFSQASFHSPEGIAVASNGDVYVADTGNHTIRKLNIRTKMVTTYVGLPRTQGFADGKGTEARFRYPKGLAFDGAGNLYVADSGNHAIRKIDAGGRVTTLTGGCGPKSKDVSVGCRGFRDGEPKGAMFRFPSALLFDQRGDLLIADTTNHRIRKLLFKKP